MNQNQERRLEEIFRKNDNKGIAIAITGSWGIGKTFFWKDFLARQLSQERTFRNEKIFNRKYAYVSLFGLESLSDLKTQIYSNIENNHSSMEVPKWLKGLPAIFKDTRINQLGISAPAKLIDTLMFSQVKDAIICFDDFERISEKLKIQDVMGLVNQLKLEKNCQVILILDEVNNKGENKKKYAEYKEKLIDETIKIASVEPLIRVNTKDIDKPLIDLMVKFADELGVHNFRFFQKVIKLYRKFLEQLPNEIAYSTKEIILIRVLQGYLIEDFGEKYEFNWADIKLVIEEKQKDWSEQKIRTYRGLESLNYAFVHADAWLIEFKKWFDQLGELDFSKFNELVNSDLISEESNKLRDDLDHLMEEWRNMEIDSSFCNRLFSIASRRIGFETLENLSFYCDLLKEFGTRELAIKLQKSIEEYLSNEYQSKGYLFASENFSFGFKSENRFHVYLKSLQEQKPYQGLPILRDIVYRYVFQSGWNSETDSIVIGQVTKADWHNLIFHEIPNDERFKESNKLQILRKLLTQQISVELQTQINDLIFEVLEEEAQASNVERRKNIEYVIKRLKE